MKTVVPIAGLILVAVCVQVSANESGRDVATKPVAKQSLSLEDISPDQVLCMKKRRTGSRVVRNVCQTLAEWKLEMEQKAIRQAHLIRPSGRPAAWETP